MCPEADLRSAAKNARSPATKVTVFRCPQGAEFGNAEIISDRVRLDRDRLLFLHIKDVEDLKAADNRGRAYRFVELGRGRVDLPAVFTALRDVKFRGWAVVELDSVPDQTRTPKESALISKKYLEEKLGMKV